MVYYAKIGKGIPIKTGQSGSVAEYEGGAL